MSRIARRNIVPVNQITPLTYRDGVTYIQMLTELSEYVKSILHPSLQHTVDQLVSEVEAQMDKHHDQYVDGVQEFQRIHDAFMSDVNAKLIALNDGAMSDVVKDESSLLSKTLFGMFASQQQLHDETSSVRHDMSLLESTLSANADRFKNDMTGQFDNLETEVYQKHRELSETVQQQVTEIEYNVQRSLENVVLPDTVARVKAILSAGENIPSFVVFLGSSTTRGGGASHYTKNYVYRLYQYLQGMFAGIPVTYSTLSETAQYYNSNHDYITKGIRVSNGGRGSTTSRNYTDKGEMDDVLSLTGGGLVVFHMIGSNDHSLLTPPDEYRDNVEQVMNSIDSSHPNAVHILVHAYERLDTPGKDRYDWNEYGERLRQLALDKPSRRMFIDLSHQFRLLGYPNTDTLGLDLGDRVHVNDGGMRLISDYIATTMRWDQTFRTGHREPKVTVWDDFRGTTEQTQSYHKPVIGDGWAATGSSWRFGHGVVRNVGTGLAYTKVTDTPGANHGVKVVLRLRELSRSTDYAGIVLAYHPQSETSWQTYFRGDGALYIARVNSSGARVLSQRIVNYGYTNETIQFSATYVDGLITVYVADNIAMSLQAATRETLLSSESQHAGIFAQPGMTAFSKFTAWEM